MNQRIVFCLLLLAPLLLSEEKAPAPKAVAVERGTVQATVEVPGTFEPAETSRLLFDFEIHRGELRLVEVQDHGTRVNAGDVVARFDARAITLQIEDDRMALDRAGMAVRHAEERLRLQSESDHEALEQARVGAARAAAKLRGYREHEKGFDDENERITVQGRKHRIEDQRDELTQLEKMYGEDELVDATEEIVLKRQRRNFARYQANSDLIEARRAYRKEFFEAWTEEDLERAAQVKQAAFERLRRTQTMAREKAEAELKKVRSDLERKRERFARLQREKEALVVRAPHRGVLMHRARGDGRLEAGDVVANRATFAEVSKGEEFEVVAWIPEADVLALGAGVAAEVTPVAAPDLVLMGRVRVAYLPGKNGKFEARARLATTDVRLRAGMTGKVRAILGAARDAVLVPAAAVVERDGKSFVRAAATAEGPFVERAVVPGVSDGKKTAIKDGVAVGEFVEVGGK